jgi:hypothetical protein
MGFYHSIVIQAPIDDVWKTIANFHDLSWADPVLTKSERIGDTPGDQVGAKRILNDQYHETLLMYDAGRFTFSYATENIPEEFLNTTVTDYMSTIRLLPVTSNNTTFLELTATFETAQPDAVVQLGNPIYEALLEALKKRIEG